MHGRTPNVHHGCTLFTFWAEVHGNNRETPEEFRGCCHGLIRAFQRRVPHLMLLPRKIPRGWPLHVPQFPPWQTPSYQPWHPPKSAAIAMAVYAGTAMEFPLQWNSAAIGIETRPSPRNSGPSAAIAEVSMDIQLQLFPRPSAAVRGHCHRNRPMLMHIR